MKSIKNNPIVKKLGFNRIILFCILVLMYVAFSIMIPGFAGMARIMSIFNYVYFLGFLALGIVVGCFAFLVLAEQMKNEEQKGESNA